MKNREILTLEDHKKQFVHSSHKSIEKNMPMDVANEKKDRTLQNKMARGVLSSIEWSLQQAQQNSDITKEESRQIEKMVIATKKIQEKLSGENGDKIQQSDVVAALDKASQNVGIDKKMLVGVSAVETDLGQNIGSVTYDDSRSKMTTKNKKIFEDLMTDLGRDPSSVKVSMAGKTGTGGAMGMAQIMPSTWKNIEKQVKQATGKENPDPYNINDAAVAMAIILKLNGAKRDESKALRMYYCGGNSEGSDCYEYADKVANAKEKYSYLL